MKIIIYVLAFIFSKDNVNMNYNVFSSELVCNLYGPYKIKIIYFVYHKILNYPINATNKQPNLLFTVSNFKRIIPLCLFKAFTLRLNKPSSRRIARRSGVANSDFITRNLCGCGERRMQRIVETDCILPRIDIYPGVLVAPYRVHVQRCRFSSSNLSCPDFHREWRTPRENTLSVYAIDSLSARIKRPSYYHHVDSFTVV